MGLFAVCGFFASLLAAINSKLSSLGRILLCFFVLGVKKLSPKVGSEIEKKEIAVTWLYVFAWTLRLHKSGSKLQMEPKMLIMRM